VVVNKGYEEIAVPLRDDQLIKARVSSFALEIDVLYKINIQKN